MDEQELSMVASLRDGRTDLIAIESIDAGLLRVVGIYGSNAAGKSSVLDAIVFMHDAVAYSHRQWTPEGPIPREPFLLSPEGRNSPSFFEADILVDRIRYQYGFRLDDKRILEEWLYAYPRGRKQVLFSRDADREEKFSFGKSLRGPNRILAQLSRPNSLFLSVAAANNHEALLPIYSWFANHLKFCGIDGRVIRESFTARQLATAHRQAIISLLRTADLGIQDVDVREESLEGQAREIAKILMADPTLESQDFKVPRLEFSHVAKEGTARLSFDSESRGTRAWFALAGPIVRVLDEGAILCIDELDASLHSHLAAEIIRIFQDPSRNPKGAQLIFNTHDTSLLGTLLGEPLLHRDQVWFVEKDERGATHLYPLTDFKPRKPENLERGYLQGRYGAIPFISPQFQSENVEKG